MGRATELCAGSGPLTPARGRLHGASGIEPQLTTPGIWLVKSITQNIVAHTHFLHNIMSFRLLACGSVCGWAVDGSAARRGAGCRSRVAPAGAIRRRALTPPWRTAIIPPALLTKRQALPAERCPSG